MKKLIFALTLVVVFAMLVSCGQSTGGAQITTANTTADAVQATTTVAAQTSAAPATTINDSQTTGAEVAAEQGDAVPSTWLSDEMINVTAAGSFGLKVDYQEIIVWQEWQDRLGIRFDINFYNSEDWSTQLNLMLASDSLPDFLCSSALSNADMASWGSQGVFVNFMDYEELIPNLKNAWMKYPGLQAAMTSYDGGVYGTKQIVTSTVNNVCRMFINKKWMDNVGADTPTTIDEFYDVLKAFKEQDANGNGDADDEIPLGYYTLSTSRTEIPILAAHGIITNATQYILQTDGGNVFLAETTDAYKAYLKFMNTLLNEGLMDGECFTLTNQEVMQNCANDKYGVYATGSAPYIMVNTSIDYDKDWLGLMGMTSEFNPTPTLGIPDGIGGFVMSINSDSQYVEELVRFVDYLCDEEGEYSSFAGYLGATFDYEFDEVLGVDVLTIYSPDEWESSDEFRQYKAIFNGPFNTFEGIAVRNAIWYDVPLETLQKDEVIENFGWIAQLAIASRNPNLTHTPTFSTAVLSYNEQETTERLSLHTDINSYLGQAKAHFILGDWDTDDDWGRFLQELNSMGLDRLMAIEQAAYSRANAN